MLRSALPLLRASAARAPAPAARRAFASAAPRLSYEDTIKNLMLKADSKVSCATGEGTRRQKRRRTGAA